MPNAPAGVVAVATSLGGVAALRRLIGGLPASLPAGVLIVQHLEPGRPSRLAELLAASTTLRVKEAEDGEPLEAGVVYLAPPDRHLALSSANRIELTRGERVHFARPAADVLFHSIAEHPHGTVVAVVLTGRGEDGSGGAAAIRGSGGSVIAQDPHDAACGEMPSAAIATGCVDLVLPLERIAPALVTLLGSS